MLCYVGILVSKKSFLEMGGENTKYPVYITTTEDVTTLRFQRGQPISKHPRHS